MQANGLRIAGVCALGVALMALPAHAVIGCSWYHPCPCSDRDSSNPDWVCGKNGNNCRCETDWNTSSNWVCTSSPPDATNEIATIGLSNHGCCSTFSNQCYEDSDCSGPLNVCEDEEHYLEIDLPTVSIFGLKIRTADVVSNDALTVKFTGGTVTANWITFDATDGPLQVSVLGTAALKTVGVP